MFFTNVLPSDLAGDLGFMSGMTEVIPSAGLKREKTGKVVKSTSPGESPNSFLELKLVLKIGVKVSYSFGWSGRPRSEYYCSQVTGFREKSTKFILALLCLSEFFVGILIDDDFLAD